MIWYDNSSKNLIKNIGVNSSVRFREIYSEVEFFMSPYELLESSNRVNKLFMEKGRVAIIDVLMALRVPIEDISTSPDPQGLRYGWNFSCFFGYDVPWITFYVSCIEENSEIIFTLGYDVDPCMNYSHCTGEDCSMCIYGCDLDE